MPPLLPTHITSAPALVACTALQPGGCEADNGCRVCGSCSCCALFATRKLISLLPCRAGIQRKYSLLQNKRCSFAKQKSLPLTITRALFPNVIKNWRLISAEHAPSDKDDMVILWFMEGVGTHVENTQFFLVCK